MGVTAGTTPKIQHGRRPRVRACAADTTVVGAAADLAVAVVTTADASCPLRFRYTPCSPYTHLYYHIMSYARRRFTYRCALICTAVCCACAKNAILCIRVSASCVCVSTITLRQQYAYTNVLHERYVVCIRFFDWCACARMCRRQVIRPWERNRDIVRGEGESERLRD